VLDYRPDGIPVLVEGDGSLPWSGGSHRVALAWTGTEYAVAYPWGHPEEGIPDHIRFLRHDALGALIDAGWTYYLSATSKGVDLVWTGDSFGLFFDLESVGILLMTLDPNGKPLGDPVIVEPDPMARFPSADLAEEGYVLVWLRSDPETDSCEWGGSCTSTEASPCSTRMRLVGLDGSTESLPGPVIVSEHGAGTAPDVARGDDGFGVVSGLNLEGDDGTRCSFRFVQVDSTLSSLSYSGMLSDGPSGDVVWAGDHYATAWGSYERPPWYDICLARFDATGDLERAPVCTQSWSSMDIGGPTTGRSNLAAGDLGMGLVFYPSCDITCAHPWFYRTDMNGVPISPMQWSEHGTWGGSAAIVWADDAFGVIYRSWPNLWFQRFVVAE
jgi:hypothetical protein